MNKEDNFKEKFKQALISTVKVISEDYKTYNNKKIAEEELKISDLKNIRDKKELIKLRAETDSEALKIKFSNKNILKENMPNKPSCKSLYNISEKIRYELLGSEMLKGISKNLMKIINIS